MIIQLGPSASLLAGRIAESPLTQLPPGKCPKSSTFMASLSFRQSGRIQSDRRCKPLHAGADACCDIPQQWAPGCVRKTTRRTTLTVAVTHPGTKALNHPLPSGKVFTII